MSDAINSYFQDTSPTKLIAGTLGASFLAWAAAKVYTDPEGVKNALMSGAFSVVKAMPMAQGKIEGELKKTLTKMEEDLHIKGDKKFLTIPEQGWNCSDVLALMSKLRDLEESKWKVGKLSGCVYHGGDEHTKMMNEALGMFSLSNPLHPDVFPAIRKFESEIVSMTVNMLGGGANGDPNVCGACTSGGTESILMACKAHREYYRKSKNITKPEMVVPVSAHAAFHKASHYFGIKLINVPCGADYCADVAAMEKAITPNTIMIVGSAPSFSNGMIDNITALGKIAKKYDIGLHVDGCLGGFLLPWMRKLAPNEIPPFDFSVPGVTTMSADTHKYGYSVKGNSVLLFRNAAFRKQMYFVATEWVGGIYASPSIAGSRPGCLIAACWASLMHMGQDGYMRNAAEILNVQRTIKQGISQMPDLELVGDSYSMVVAFKAKSFDTFMISDVMSNKGWNLNALQKPNSLHLCVTYAHAGKAEEFLSDLNEAIVAVKQNPNAYKEGAARMYGLAHGLPDRGIVGDIVTGFLDVCLKP